ncbi:MAG: hypothetical protein JST16_15455 [Bdellovibrionales bacterium]|nr:hypothetical protein [Bdellovibrionales bacterium]
MKTLTMLLLAILGLNSMGARAATPSNSDLRAFQRKAEMLLPEAERDFRISIGLYSYKFSGRDPQEVIETALADRHHHEHPNFHGRELNARARFTVDTAINVLDFVGMPRSDDCRTAYAIKHDSACAVKLLLAQSLQSLIAHNSSLRVSWGQLTAYRAYETYLAIIDDENGQILIIDSVYDS